MADVAVIDCGGGRVAHAVEVTSPDELSSAIQALRLSAPHPVVVVVGGAAGLSGADTDRLGPLAEEIVHAAQLVGGVLVDGGTDAGVMRVIGQASSRLGHVVPLIGVVVKDLASLPGQAPTANGAPVELNHSHFIFVPGSQWGDESHWIANVASSIAGGEGSTTILVNGGDISWHDVQESVAAGRPVLVVANTGRTAEQLAAALEGRPHDERADPLVATGLVSVAESGHGPHSLAAKLRELLSRDREVGGRDGH